MSSTGIQSIAQLAYTVSDLKRSIAFYRDTMGLRFLFEAPPAPVAAWLLKEPLSAVELSENLVRPPAMLDPAAPMLVKFALPAVEV